MKICKECGTQNKDDAKFCASCGANLNVTNPISPQSNIPVKSKNGWLAAILCIVGALILYCLCGIGHFYLRLNKRGIFFCVIGLALTLLNFVIKFISDTFMTTVIAFVIGMGFAIYSAYDAYNCASAINEARELPLIFGSIDIK